MAAGCVVIVNNFSGISEIISEIDGFVIEHKENNLKNLINFLDQNEEVQKDISQNGISKS